MSETSSAPPPRVERFLEADLAEPLVVSFGDGVLVAWTRTCPGGKRPNEDAVGLVILDEQRAVLAVADGAGGMPLGNKAAGLSITRLTEEVVAANKASLPIREGVLRGFEAANQAVIDLAVGAASTLVCIEIEGAKVRTYHAGDSRALICGQRGRLRFLTTAHSPVGYQVEAGLMDESAALHDRQLHEVSNIVGAENMRVEVGPTLSLLKRDSVLLGSDGVFDNFDPSELVERLRKGPLPQAMRRLITDVDLRMKGASDGTPSKPDDCGFIAYRPTRHGG